MSSQSQNLVRVTHEGTTRTIAIPTKQSEEAFRQLLQGVFRCTSIVGFIGATGVVVSLTNVCQNPHVLADSDWSLIVTNSFGTGDGETAVTSSSLHANMLNTAPLSPSQYHASSSFSHDEDRHEMRQGRKKTAVHNNKNSSSSSSSSRIHHSDHHEAHQHHHHEAKRAAALKPWGSENVPRKAATITRSSSSGVDDAKLSRKLEEVRDKLVLSEKNANALRNRLEDTQIYLDEITLSLSDSKETERSLELQVSSLKSMLDDAKYKQARSEKDNIDLGGRLETVSGQWTSTLEMLRVSNVSRSECEARIDVLNKDLVVSKNNVQTLELHSEKMNAERLVEKGKLEKEIADLKLGLVNYEHKYNNMHETLSKEVDKYKHFKAALETEIGGLNSHIADTVAQLSENARKYSSRDTDYKDSERSLSNQAASLKKILEDAKDRQIRAEKDILDLGGRLETVSGQLTSTLEMLRVSNVSRSECEARIDVLNKDSVVSKNNVQTLELQKQSLEGILEMQSRDILRITLSLQHSEEMNAERLVEKGKLEKEIADLKLGLVNYEHKYNNMHETLSKEVDKYKHFKAALETEIGDLNSHIADTVAQLSEHTRIYSDQISQLKQTVAGSKESERSLELQVSSLKLMLDDAKYKQARSEKDNIDLKSRLETISGTLDQNLELLRNINASKSDCESRIDVMNKELIESKHNADDLSNRLNEASDQLNKTLELHKVANISLLLSNISKGEAESRIEVQRQAYEREIGELRHRIGLISQQVPQSSNFFNMYLASKGMRDSSNGEGSRGGGRTPSRSPSSPAGGPDRKSSANCNNFDSYYK